MSFQRNKMNFRKQSNGAKKKESGVIQKAGEMAAEAGKKADEAASTVGAGMQSWADNIRENVRDQGERGSVAAAAADVLDSGGRYLEKQGLSGIGSDLANLIRQHPLPAVCLGIALGFLLARGTQSRSS